MTLFILLLIRVGNSHYFQSDILRGKNKIYTSACYGALRHIWLHGCVGLLGNRNGPHFFYAAQCCCPNVIITRDNNSDKFAVPVLR